MFGNTRRIAESITEVLGATAEAKLVRAGVHTEVPLDGVDLLVVGAPTHAWSLPRANTRRGALENVRKSGGELVLEENADSLPGVREWLDSLASMHALGAAFDTRLSAPAALTGRASKVIATSLGRHGLELVVPAESFLVDRRNRLVDGEVNRARAWASTLAVEAMHRLSVDH
ncbi:MAG TPA: hypothetical protein VMV53_06060 [Acidimicrobiales bacterium]|nr:hypothetical protein [Acidimicrobiales bacterium]